jgi:phosphoesterase RecJ-like protein
MDQPQYSRSLSDAIRFMRERDDFLVVSHVQPDGDAIASTCAVGWILSALGKRFVLANEDPVPEKFRFLPGADRIRAAEELAGTAMPANLICVDCADYARIGSIRHKVPGEAALLNIDHHPTNDAFGTVNLLKFDAAATVQILYDLIETAELRWTRDAAECIYAGLLTDTGGFRYANTTPQVMRIAAHLLQEQADGHKLAQALLERTSLPHVLLLKKALAALSFTDDRRIAWMSVTAQDLQETGALEEDLDGLVNYPRNIHGVEVGLLFKERAGHVKVSLRSAGKVDVSAIAQRFGGGGHVLAAGCTIEDSLASAVRLVVEAVKQALR